MHKQEEGNNLKRYFFYGVLAAIFIVSYFIVKDFFIESITAIVLAFLIKPLTDKLAEKISRPVAALISVISLLTIITISITFIAKSILKEVYILINSSTPNEIINLVSKFPESEIIINNMDSIKGSIGNYLISKLPSLAFLVPKTLFSLFIIFFLMYYILVDWYNIKARIINAMPFKNKAIILKRIEKVSSEIIYGTLIIGIIEAVVAIIGFSLLGIKLAVLFGIIIGIFAVIPLLGPIIIWLPLMVIEIINGNYLNATLLLILGLILSVGIDWLLRIKILQKRSEIHPIIMLIGVIGGIRIFGITGFIIGPLILSIALSLAEEIATHESK
ncbi:MAG: AI-2E family transporter [Candidatus Pacearchaeota archaeon]